MTLLLRSEDHDGLLDFSEAIDAIEKAFLLWAQDPSCNLPRQIVSEGIRLAVHQASVAFLNAAGLMAHTRGVQAGPGKHDHHAASLVFNLETGLLDAILLDQVLCGSPIAGVTDIRTAATSAVGTKVLARKDAKSVGVLGSGRQARSHLVATASVRAVNTVKVYSRSGKSRELYAREMAGALGIDVRPVSTAEAAVDGMDIILVMTDADEPVLSGEWLSAGQHVTSVLGGNTPRDKHGRPSKPPRRDLDDQVIRRSDVIVINSRAQAVQDWQGDIVLPIESGLLSWEQVHELSELISGRVPGRTSAEQITLYKNNGGQGVADVAIAAMVAKRARELGRGVEV